MNADEAKQIEQSLCEVLGYLKGILREPDYTNASELIDAGEYGIALDVICAQLFEFEISVPRAAYVKLEEIGQRMHIPKHTWTILQPLVIESENDLGS